MNDDSHWSHQNRGPHPFILAESNTITPSDRNTIQQTKLIQPVLAMELGQGGIKSIDTWTLGAKTPILSSKTLHYRGKLFTTTVRSSSFCGSWKDRNKLTCIKRLPQCLAHGRLSTKVRQHCLDVESQQKYTDGHQNCEQTISLTCALLLFFI